MIALLKIGRFLMVVSVVYALILLFARRYLRRPPRDLSASLQAIAACAAGGALARCGTERAAADAANP